MAKTIAQRLTALEKAVTGFLGGKAKKAKRSKRKSKTAASRKATGKAKRARRPAALPFPPG